MNEGMPLFPQSERVVYRNNPLNEVVCQIRFPTILRVVNEIPSDFQESIRGDFPEYQEEVNSLVPAGLPPQIVQLLSGSTMAKRHRFATRDSKFAVLLDGQALTFVAGDYVCWEDFSQFVFSTIESFCAVYAPSFLSRVGLRYQNLISEPAESSGLNWHDLIRPELVGVLANDDWAQNTTELASVVKSSLGTNNTDRLIFQYGLAELEGSSDKYFRLDFDYYVEQETEPADAKSIIERLHGYTGAAFRWAITERLHQALEPPPTV